MSPWSRAAIWLQCFNAEWKLRASCVLEVEAKGRRERGETVCLGEK